MFKAPPTRKLQSIFRKTVTLSKITTSGNDDAYGQKSETSSGTYRIRAEIQEITSYDLAYFVPGTVQIGDAWGYFLPSYTVNGKKVEIALEDEITWNGKTWEIDRIEDAYIGEKLWYRKAYLRRKVPGV